MISQRPNGIYQAHRIIAVHLILIGLPAHLKQLVAVTLLLMVIFPQEGNDQTIDPLARFT